MMRRSIGYIAVLTMTSAHCFGDVSELIEYHWQIFTNISRFPELFSTTNIPAEVRSNILRYQAEAIAEAKQKEETGNAPMAGAFKLDWAATDGTNYVVHWEIVPASLDQTLWMEGVWPCITAAIPGTGGTHFIVSTGPCLPLDNYKQFIEYEVFEANEKLDEETTAPWVH